MNDYQQNKLMNQLFSEDRNPVIYLKNVLQKVAAEKIDFVLITGDLVHEGAKEDYDLFKSIWQDYLPDTPYFFCRGNHDRRDVFADGMGVATNEQNDYIALNEFKGLRIISLDTAQDLHHEGKISIQQMEQLKDWLSVPAEKGTLLLLHHPLAWEEAGIATETPAGFTEIIANSDILGIFVGHIHQGTTASYGGKNQYMTEAISFGVDEFSDESVFTDRTGYNSCSLTENGLVVYQHGLTPKQSILGRIPKPIEGNF